MAAASPPAGRHMKVCHWCAKRFKEYDEVIIFDCSRALVATGRSHAIHACHAEKERRPPMPNNLVGPGLPCPICNRTCCCKKHCAADVGHWCCQRRRYQRFYHARAHGHGAPAAAAAATRMPLTGMDAYATESEGEDDDDTDVAPSAPAKMSIRDLYAHVDEETRRVSEGRDRLARAGRDLLTRMRNMSQLLGSVPAGATSEQLQQRLRQYIDAFWPFYLLAFKQDPHGNMVVVFRVSIDRIREFGDVTQELYDGLYKDLVQSIAGSGREILYVDDKTPDWLAFGLGHEPRTPAPA